MSEPISAGQGQAGPPPSADWELIRDVERARRVGLGGAVMTAPPLGAAGAIAAFAVGALVVHFAGRLADGVSAAIQADSYLRQRRADGRRSGGAV